ncbi:MAG TPA: cell surface protein SprA, partial [Gemmatimonadaceae bacterium]|nr:cell surface protein SprA [Gemmatimonadaceae bacterium]
TLFPRARQVAVQFEENPLFALASTSIFGLTTQFPLENGQINFTAISQSQQSSFNRPPLGFEPVSTIIAGVNGNFTVDSPTLTRALDALPMVRTSAPSSVTVQGEFATSRPQGRGEDAAYVESFEGEGGFTISLQESAWRYGSQPAINGAGLPLAAGAYGAGIDSATTLAWQNLPTVTDPATGIARVLQISAERIDTQFVFIGAQSFRVPETVLWTVLFPTSVGGFRHSNGGFQWTLPHRPGRRWRSITQPLSPTGVDLTRIEQLEFWALIDTSSINRPKNPTLVFDFGDVSENSVTFAPESLSVRTVAVQGPQGATIVVDSTFSGRALTGFDRLDSERDSITRSFDAAINDVGIPGDRVESLVVVNEDDGSTQSLSNVRLCTRGITSVLPLADTRNNCSAGNRRLNEEDLDLDGVLNIASANRNSERLVRFVVDMSDRTSYTRVGLCYRSVTDTIPRTAGSGQVCWVQFRLPFSAPTELVGDPLVRRVKSVRLTVVSGTGDTPNEFRTVPVARLRLTGSPWIKRADQPIAGVGGAGASAAGFVVAAVIGTQDRDPASGLLYESPPGVTDEADNKQTSFAPGQVQVNERSLRLLAGNVGVFQRAEAYYRFPEGEKNLMGYEELRVWARGRNKGWGPQGDLQFYIKLGRDADNFYFYRTPVNAGSTREAWLPEIRVDFRRFFALRAQIQNAFLRGGDTLACSGLDSALVVNSAPAPSAGVRRFAACEGGYIVYTSNPGITPPNLAAVQEMAVGIVRTSNAGLSVGGPISPTDTLELWVDDVRLTNLVRDAGYAGQFGVSVIAADVFTLQANVSRKDGNFRQLSELPTFITDDQLNIASSVRLDKLLPSSLGLLLPLSVNHARFGTDPFFLSRSDISAAGVDGIRTPSSSATSLALSARRATPLQRELIGPIVNNLALQATYASSSAESEFQTGRSSSFTSSLDYNLTSRGRTTPLPGWLNRTLGRLPGWLRETEFVRAVRGSALRWTPTQVRFTTGYARNVDRRTSFTLPIASPDDSGRRVDGLTSVWRNMGVVELRPFNSLTARWNLTSWRDMRDYGDSTTVARAAEAERERLLGMDVGLERERQMTTVISAAPVVTSWLRPRLEFSGSYSMLRDPNARGLIADVGGELHLPRRVSNSQGLGATTIVDLGRLMTIYSGEASLWRQVARVVQPVEVIWRRDLRS